MTILGAVPAWHRNAACGNLGKLFASKKARDIDAQRKVCAGCTVLGSCAAAYKATPKGDLPDLVMAGQTRPEFLGVLQVNTRRKCTKCGENKLLNAFVPKTQGKHGRRSICKACENARQRAVYQAKKTKTATEGTTG
ncbi:hypothetical protein AB0I81_30110 [Nonomuraea sp. NPDC050404]|uniref:hypothetical protein n=1 Tax=Nonomuraea sp. NPDC050404 TaxID=3155783 RepID=UPI0033C0C0A4